jgi:hypothetical protein
MPKCASCDGFWRSASKSSVVDPTCVETKEANSRAIVDTPSVSFVPRNNTMPLLLGNALTIG